MTLQEAERVLSTYERDAARIRFLEDHLCAVIELAEKLYDQSHAKGYLDILDAARGEAKS